MKSIKLFYMGRPLRDVYPHATKWQVFKWRVSEFLKKLLRLFTLGTVIAIAVVAVYTAGQWSTPEHVIAEATQVEQSYAVLNRIADCESGNGKAGTANHYKNGQVVLKANTNGTVDIGKYQVNLTYWGKKATELGLDLTKEVDNKKMAEWIYFNKGTGDWSASMKCWQK